MNTAQLKIEVDHILDSGANDIRFIELIKRLLKKEAISFAEWMRDNHYIHNSLINKDGKFWFRQYTSPNKRELHTTEQLYQIYKSTHP